MKEKERKIEYIEVTRKRYYHVQSGFKYITLDGNGERHYHLARNRARLQDELEEKKGYLESLI